MGADELLPFCNNRDLSFLTLSLLVTEAIPQKSIRKMQSRARLVDG